MISWGVLIGLFWRVLMILELHIQLFILNLQKFTILVLEKRKTKRGGIHKPWLTKGLLKSIKKKNVLYRRYVSNPTHDRECFYKNYKNRLNHSLRLANKALEKSKSSLKQT